MSNESFDSSDDDLIDNIDADEVEQVQEQINTAMERMSEIDRVIKEGEITTQQLEVLQDELSTLEEIISDFDDMMASFKEANDAVKELFGDADDDDDDAGN